MCAAFHAAVVAPKPVRFDDGVELPQAAASTRIAAAAGALERLHILRHHARRGRETGTIGGTRPARCPRARLSAARSRCLSVQAATWSRRTDTRSCIVAGSPTSTGWHEAPRGHRNRPGPCRAPTSGNPPGPDRPRRRLPRRGPPGDINLWGDGARFADGRPVDTLSDIYHLWYAAAAGPRPRWLRPCPRWHRVSPRPAGGGRTSTDER